MRDWLDKLIGHIRRGELRDPAWWRLCFWCPIWFWLMRPADRQAHEPAINDHHYWYCVDAKNETIASVKIYERHGVQWMTDVWVDTAYRRQGLATRLITAALARYGHADLYLQVHGYHDRPLGDDQLAAFYGRFGFEVIAGAPGMMRRPGGLLREC